SSDLAGTRFTLPCEAVFNRHPLVRRTALVGVPTTRPGVQRPVVCVELEAGARIATSTLFAELRALGSEFEHTRDLDTFLLHPAFPVDARHNAKIFRERLAVWAEQKLR